MNKSSKSLLKRLESIIYDADYVRQCAQSLQLPVVANQRCGSWYVAPDILALSCYFKSTDGHVNQWAFNYRRLNLHLLPLIEKHNGCIIVDSTRGSKSFSDALTKTIPIWCAVLNRLLFSDHEESKQFVLPSPEIVPVQEQHAIEQALPSLHKASLKLDLDVTSLRQQVTRPLRPHFLQPTAKSPASLIISPEESLHNIVLLMASSNEPHLPFPGYIRGAGDDEDNWCLELTPVLFWQRNEEIIGTLADPNLDYASVLREISPSVPTAPRDPLPIGLPGLFIGITSVHIQQHLLESYDPFQAIIVCDTSTTTDLTATNLANQGKTLPFLRLNLPPGKIGSRQLRSAFPQVVAFLSMLEEPNPSILVTDAEGRDHAVAVSLLISCLFYTGRGFAPVAATRQWTKEEIRRHLAVFTSYQPDISPSRASLQSLHAFLMPPESSEDQKRTEILPPIH